MPEATHSETVAEQIAFLRRQNQELARRLRLLTRGVAATAIVGLLMIAAGARRNVEVPKSIEAERFVVRDAEGKVRMEFYVREDGMAGISIRDPQERTRIGLAVAKEGAAVLGMKDANDEQLVSLDLIEANGARLALQDAKHRNNIVLRSMPTDNAFIGILGPTPVNMVIDRCEATFYGDSGFPMNSETSSDAQNS